MKLPFIGKTEIFPALDNFLFPQNPSSMNTGGFDFQIMKNHAFRATCKVLVLGVNISALCTVNNCQQVLILTTTTARQHNSKW